MNTNGENRKRDEIADDASEWVERVFAHDASAADEVALREWTSRSTAHADALADAVAMRLRVIDACDAIRTDPAAAAMLAEARAITPRPLDMRMGRRAFLTGAVAATAAGVMAVYPPLGLWTSLGELRADYRTGTGERRTVQIARGLSVELNTRTALSRRSDDAAYRLALISGEVAVDVERLARPAIVQSAQGQASTRNGQFSARLEDDGLCVTCFAGTVAVRGRDALSAQLVEGQQLVLGRSAHGKIISVDPVAASGWRRGVLIFNARPLADVVSEINRYRPGRLILANSELASRSINAIFHLDRLDIAPEQMRVVAGATVTHLPGGVVLLS